MTDQAGKGGAVPEPEPSADPPPGSVEEFRRQLRAIREEVEAIFAQDAEGLPPDEPPPPPTDTRRHP